MKLPTPLIGLIVIAMLLAVGIWRKKSAVPVVTSLSAPQVMPARMATANGKRNEQPKQEQLKLQHNLLIAQKLRPIVTSHAGKADKLSIGFDMRALWCKTGDLDTVKALAPGLRQKAFQLSLETLGGDRTVQSVRLSLDDITKERAQEFSLPPTQEEQIVSVSLCLASGGQRCQDQEVWNPQEPLSHLEKSSSLLFYSQYLLRTQDGMYLVSTERWGNDSVARIKKTLKGLDTESLNELTKGFAKIRIIKPMPAVLSAKGLLLPLSYNDPRCITHQAAALNSAK